MDPVSIGLILVIVMLVILISGGPIAIALGGVGVVGVLAMRPWGAAEYLLASFPYSYTATFTFIVLPLFLFMGYMAFAANLSKAAFEAAERWIGQVPGGLAMATVFACAAFSAVCGSSVATASTITKVAMPEMRKRNYKDSLAGGAIAAGGTLGVLIPPSGILVIYSFVTDVSLVKLFFAALIPGLLTAVIYVIGIYIWVRINPEVAGSMKGLKTYSWSERWGSLFAAWEVALLFAVVMGSIYIGFATPTEAAAVGALMSVLMVLRRKDAWRNLKTGLWDTSLATSSVFLLVIGAGLFSMALNLSQLPVVISDWISDLNVHRMVVFALIILMYLVLGAIVDGLSMILITMPVIFPIIIDLGFDPVWFGIVVVKAVELGCITPPVGLNVYVVKSTAPDADLGQIFRGIVPFVIMELLIIGLLVAFPALALSLVP